MTWERVRKRATLSSCSEWTAMVEASNYGFGTRRPEKSSGEETSSGAPTLRTPFLETPAAGPSARVRPRQKSDGGSKAGNRDDNEGTTSGGAATFHTPILETRASGMSARMRPRVMNGGGGKAGNQSNVEEKRPGTGTCKGANGEVGSNNEVRADRPSPTRKRAESAELVRPRRLRRDDRTGTWSLEIDPDEG